MTATTSTASFSQADINEVEDELGFNDELDAANDNGPAINPTLEQRQADQIYAERKERAQNLFYSILCAGFDGTNAVVSRKLNQSPYRSLDLKFYAEGGRAASDQFFNNLCENEFLARWLYRLNENELMEKWGVILTLAYTMQQNFRAEFSARHELIKAAADAANDNTAEGAALKEKPLKEKAA